MHVDAIHSAPLLDGLPGVHQTLSAMAQLVRRDSNDLLLRGKALEIVGGCGGHDFDCEIQALYAFCRDNITYRRDPVEQERVQDARRTIYLFGSGDCDDKVVCLASLLGTLGHKSRFKVLGQRRGNYSHVYLEAQRKDGSWLSLDPTPEQASAGWEARGGHAATYEIFTSSGNPVLFVAGALLLYWLLR
jgi:Transglutaminase-like superfamily